jgi:hypothetical protein
MVLVALVSATLTVVVGALVLTTDANNRVQSSLTSLNRVIEIVTGKPGTELTLTDFERLQASVRDLERNLSTARQQVAFLQPLASLNLDLEITLEALEAAQELALAANDMLEGAQPTLFFLVAGDDTETVVAQISSGERVVELLHIGGSRFVSAGAHLDQAQSLIDDLDLTGISSGLLLQIEGLSGTYDQLREINSLLLVAPDLLTTALGLNDQQSYLILAQNSDEIRPSGGYISTYGWMTVRNGRILDYNYNPTTTTSPNPPRSDLASQIAIPDWWLQYSESIYTAWDGSWHADFPSTAELAKWYYDNGDNPSSPVDGVIAIDIVGFEYLLQAMESVVVPDYQVIITPENFREVVYNIRAFGEGERPHKRFVADVYQQIFDDWQNVDRDTDKSTNLLGATLQALQEKHIMLFFADDGLNKAVDQLGWSGRQAAAIDHDYFMMVDANLGNKSNRSIVRQLTYDVTIQSDGSLQSRASISYDYPSRLADEDPAIDPLYHGPIDYNNLLQLFVPANSEIVETNNLQTAVEQIETGNHTTFVSRLRVDYDNSERVQFTYNTPVLVDQFGPYRRYRLLLQKQPGTLAETVSVQVTLPPDAQTVSTTPAPVATFQLEQPIIEFRVNLMSDRWITVIYQEAS